MDALQGEECTNQYTWQSTSFPSCNSIHEIDIRSSIAHSSYLLTHGYWRDIWVMVDDSNHNNTTMWALKTLRFKHEWNYWNWDRHRRDAVATERLTPSPFVLDIYAYCGNSIFTEYGEHDLFSFVRPKDDRNPVVRLKVAYQIAHAIADVHNIPMEGVASLAHTDISPGQFIYSKGIYKLVCVLSCLIFIIRMDVYRCVLKFFFFVVFFFFFIVIE